MRRTIDHYSDHIQRDNETTEFDVPGPEPARVLWDFDARGFANTLVRLRREHHYTTRQLAARAAISQAYVVALERPRRRSTPQAALATAPPSSTPTPAVDVLARIAAALGVSPAVLLQAALKRSGRHVLCVVEDATVSPLQIAAATAPDVDTWVWVGAPLATDNSALPAHRRIDLRRDRAGPYDSTAISDAVGRELRMLAPPAGERLGLVFAETTSAISLMDVTAVLDFEHSWSDVVTRAAWSVGAHATWNVCVYDLDSLHRLADPLASSVDLLRSHDEYWVAGEARVRTGRSAALRLLRQVKPTSVGVVAWRKHSTDLLADLGVCG